MIKLLQKQNGAVFYASQCRCETTVLAFTVSVTVMLLLTNLTSAPDDKSIGIEHCQKICEKVLSIPISILHTKSIANCANTRGYY